ncbi:hypothetical protein C7293_13845 [filamentous cyanobacterium CCT1]|nr:hypothetical protein C7293_13845 [filamentous cyanobacterium CCT1]PSN79160.1 hypothetical protein C8B47_13130 [filamentous cyanobacterium CCP4]
MFKILIDTCVWLDIAKDPRQLPLLSTVEELIRLNKISLIVPDIILTEFRRNRERIAKESAKSLSSHFKVVKEAVNKLGGEQEKVKAVISHLDDVNHKIPFIGGEAVNILDRIEKLLSTTDTIEVSDDVKLRAAQRAVKKKAPFHRGKNSMADAILIETYANCVNNKSAARVRFAFITHNKSDFSVEQGNQKDPHPDLANTFSPIKSLYFINLTEALRRIEPSLLMGIMFESSWTQEPRGLSEILEAENLLFYQVWYNRHWNLRIDVEEGNVKIVDKETYPKPPNAPKTIQSNVWEGALKSAKEVERSYGKENLGPWDDFEWGMINGKLSALRWVLGDDWDMLDT